MTHNRLIDIRTFAQHLGLGLCRWLFSFRKLLVQGGDFGHAWSIFIGSRPLTKEDLAFLLHQGIRDRICPRDSKSFQQGLVGKFAKKAFASVLDKKVENGKGAQLPV